MLLDFWTFCCVNCLHVLDELRPLEERYGDVLVTIGVHSPKFEHEADADALVAAVERYEVHHPVLDDPELVTWKAFAARAWPTLTVIDPEGYVVAQLSGEGHAHGLGILLDELVAEHEAKGTLHRGDGPYVPPPAAVHRAALSRQGRSRCPAARSWSATPRTTSWSSSSPTWSPRCAGSVPAPRVWSTARPRRAQLSEPQGLLLLPETVAGAGRLRRRWSPTR